MPLLSAGGSPSFQPFSITKMKPSFSPKKLLEDFSSRGTPTEGREEEMIRSN
jgi:hypothetical protein